LKTRKYALRKGEPPRLEVSFHKEYDNLTIRIDGEVIESELMRMDLISGKTIQLEDGSMLKVQLITNYRHPELSLLLDGKPLPGSASDPEHILSVAQAYVTAIGILYVILGFIADIWEVEILFRLGLGFFSILLGGCLLILSQLVKQWSVFTLSLVIALIIADGILYPFLAQKAGFEPLFSGVYARILLILILLRGILAILNLKGERALSPTDSQ